ncbi:MAG: hypothetical protein JWR35_2918 [Marmoricola sp.]|jgi:ABC-2 type transport system permease protein|nr:hypothetical protein [Marmoricola sp.]
MRAVNKKRPVTDERGRRKNAASRARKLAEKKADSMPAVAPLDGPRLVRHVPGPLVDPAPSGGIREVLSQRYLLKLIVGRELAQMYAASLLGLLWSYVQPAVRFGTYYLVFAVILDAHRSVPDFAVHMFTGQVFVHLFSETWSGGTRSIWQNRSLVLKMRMPREIFPVAAFVVALYHTFPQILLLVFWCFMTGWHPGLSSLAAGALGVAILVTFGLALSLFFAAFNVFFRDFQNIVATILSFLHFMVPMMYAFSLVYNLKASQAWMYNIYVGNPLAEGVILMQKCFWFSSLSPSEHHGNTVSQAGGPRTIAFPPDMWERGVIMLLICFVLLYAGQKYFARVEGRFPERL